LDLSLCYLGILCFKVLNIYINNNAMFIYVTHDQEEAFKLATKILILDRGKILQYGSRDEIIDLMDKYID